MPDILLPTKLFAPPLRSRLVPRPHLIEKLDNGLTGKLTLVTAPAGFGKTMLVVEWLHHHERPFAWLSLDEDDNELKSLFSYLNATIQQLAGVGSILPRLLTVAQPVSGKAFSAAFIHDVSTIVDPFTLVLDDYHFINNAETNEAVSQLLEHMPGKMHLLITSRTDPLLPLPRLRARGQMAELRMDDLRFTGPETVAFLQQTMGLSLSKEQIESLDKRVEGWIAGWQMVGLSLQQLQTEAQIQHFLADFTASHRYIFDYLTDEVLAHRPPNTRDFLLKTSILEQFNADLCVAITGQEDSQTILEYLDKANLFLFPLDENREWYRYHHLFADLLRQRLKRSRPEIIPTLYHQAGRWFAQHGDVETAIQYTLAGGDMAAAARLLDPVALDFIATSEGQKLLKMAGRLPAGIQSQYTRLCLALGWANVLTGELAVAEKNVQQAENSLVSPAMAPAEFPERLSRAYIASIRAYIATRRGNFDRAIALSTEARDGLKGLPEEITRSLFGTSTLSLGQAYTALDQLDTAETMYQQALQYNLAAGRVNSILSTYSNIIVLQQRRGQLSAAKSTGLQALAWLTAMKQRTGEKAYTAEGEIRRELAKITYEQNALVAAREHLQQGLDLYQYVFPAGLTRCLHILFMVQMAEGNIESALRTHHQIDPILSELTKTFLYQLYIAYRMERIRRLSLALPEEAHWLDALRQEFAMQSAKQARTINFYREHAAMIRARALAALNQDEAALAIIQKLASAAQTASRTGDLILCRVQQALVLNRLSRPEVAVSHLTEAIMLAEKEGYLRTFLDDGAALRPLLPQCPASPYRDKLIDYIAQEQPAYAPSLPITSSVLLEPLSARELEVLPLLATHLSGPEIAFELHISLNTLKTHLRNIYSKLAVHSRNEAVVKAQAAGLL